MGRGAKSKNKIKMRIFLNLSLIFILIGLYSCGSSKKSLNGDYYNYPSRNKSSMVVRVKDSILLISFFDNSSGEYLCERKGDTLFLNTLRADSSYWKTREPIKYALVKKGFIFINKDFTEIIQTDVYSQPKYPILARKKDMFFSFKMSILYRNELKRLLKIKNKSALMRCQKIVELFEQDCSLKLYYKLSKRDIGL